MPKHSETRNLKYSAQNMFDLVADVASYPEFLPWCVAARVRSRVPKGDAEEMLADLVIGFQVFRERFGSRVMLFADDHRIETDYLDGPFKYLKSTWRFEPNAEGGCHVDFFVDFEFKSKVLQGVIGVVFNEAMQRIVRAFEERAEARYG